MSNLRKHLQSEKERHHGMVYPGNLAQELLGATKVRQASMMDYADASLRKRRSLGWWIGLAGLGAAAALIVLVMRLRPASLPQVASESQPTIEAVDDTEDFDIALNTTESMPDDVPVMLSSAGSITPEYQSMSFSSIPSFSSSFSDLSTTEDQSN